MIAKKVRKGSKKELIVMAGDGFLEPIATYNPVPPPRMMNRNGASCLPNDPRNINIINMHVATPRNKKKTVPKLVPMAIRLCA